MGLLPALREFGVASEVAVGADGPLAERLARDGFAVHPINLLRSRMDLGAALRLARLLRRTAPDLVHHHGTRAAFFGALARRLGARMPAVYTVHGFSHRRTGPWRRLFFAAERFACRGLAGLVSVSAADRDEAVRNGFVAANDALHVPNAVDTRRFGPGGRVDARRRLGLPADRVIVGTVSRLVLLKGVDTLITAVSLCPNIHLVIAGDGPERPALERKAEAVRGRVTFLGMRDDVPEVLRAFDVFALASRWEGEGVALLEAMATEIPCVATETSGAHEVLAGTNAGIVVEQGSAAALATAFGRLRDDSGLRDSMGRAGRVAVSSRSWSDGASRLAAFYEEVLRK